MKRPVSAILVSTIFITSILLIYCGGGGSDSPSTPVTPSGVSYQLEWINFSPYVDDQDPNLGSVVSEQQIRDRLRIISPYVKGVRTFGSSQGLEKVARIAKSEFKLKTTIGAWLGKDLAANATEMTNLIAAAKSGHVDIAVVGNEVLLRGDLSESELIAYINQFRAEVPSVPVTTAEVYSTLLAHPNVIAACDKVYVNIYPYWEGIRIESAVAYIHAHYLEVSARSSGKEVFISETGWPNAGNTVGSAVPSSDNAAYHFISTVSWSKAEGANLIYFEAFDESWKSSYEGPQGAHWGIWDKNGQLKPGMARVFNNESMADNWSCGYPPGGSGTAAIEFTYVPSIGSDVNLRGQIWHVVPADYRVAVYIKVGSGWWTKPTFAAPLTLIDCEGVFETDITTGGSDPSATEIAAYLVSKTHSPPVASGSALPETELNANALASVRVTR